MTSNIAIVTGGSRGIGRATALRLAAAGYTIVVNYAANEAAANAVVQAVTAQGGKAVAVRADVAKEADVLALFAEADKLGPLKVLVNNAGVGVLKRGDLLEVTEASWDRCLAVNSKAMFFLSQAFARRLLSRRRPDGLFHSVVNVTSSNAVAVAVRRAEYCASKAAAAMISKALAVRLGGENIAVYDVQPGLIATDMTAPVIEMYRRRAEEGLTLFPRVGQPADMGAIIAALASGRLPYTTGQAISADAGMLVPRF